MVVPLQVNILRMKLNQKLLFLLWGFATLVQGAALDARLQTAAELKPERYEAQAAHLAAEVLSRYHYKAAPLDPALSEKIFDQYLKALDGEKYYFVQTDIDRFAGQRGQLGNAILKEDLSLPFSIFNLYEQRVVQRFGYARTLLTQGIDFKLHEELELTRDKVAWPQSEADMRDLWRRKVKNDWLRLKIAGKDSASITAILDKRYAHAMQRIGKAKHDDVFQTFMNAYTMSIDPHTNYMAPRAAQEFDISMRLSLTGIGATLAESEDYTTVRELIAGGPASLSGQVHVGDRIVGVGQGATGAMVDILGWRQDDAIELIRGAADTQVRLDILPAKAGPDGEHKLVTLVRKPVRVIEQAAKSSIQSITDGAATRRIGVITLPSFYEDFAAKQAGNKNYTSATRDVAKLVEDLKKQQVDSLLIDLRNNGGGSLAEAVELSGLFVGNGPVVQQRKANGSVSVEKDTQAKVAWTGPLGILINRGSASASEIFAAAMQDYGRGLVIGDPSFGKGTVQTMIDLDQIAKNEKPRFGELKMTVAQFFRVNGGTTQMRGVVPDIPLQGGSDEGDFGESSFGNALPWSQIKAADYSPSNSMKALVPVLLKKHEARAKVDAGMQQLREDIAKSKREREKNVISLNEADRRKDRDAREALLASRTPAQQAGKASVPATADAANDDGLQPNERSLAKSLSAEKVRKDAKDIFLIEAAHILSDQISATEAELSPSVGAI
jgi:carboxyl-terminal processing protease